MAIQTTSNLSDSIRARYTSKYLEAAKFARLYDQAAVPLPGLSMQDAIRGSSVNVPFLGDMDIGVTAISESTDITPQKLPDTTASVTPTSRAEALQWTETVDIQAYTNYGESRFKAVGKNMMESVDLLAQAVALKGSLVIRGAGRSSLDAGTNDITDAEMSKAQAILMSLKVPGFENMDGQPEWMAIMHPFVFHDVREGGNVDSIGLYQDKGIHLNFELGKVGPFRLVVSPWAKIFGGAGADNGSNADTTLSSAASKQDTTIEVASATNLDTGEWLTIGTEETANTHYPENERVRYVSESGTTITIVGEGSNGGLRFDHASGVAVRNADSVYTVAFAGPQSLVKLFAPSVGEFGKVVGPKLSGNVDQFATLGWKFHGQYGRLTENALVRGEYSVSHEA